jgi:hypothetical protein
MDLKTRVLLGLLVDCDDEEVMRRDKKAVFHVLALWQPLLYQELRAAVDQLRAELL